MAHACTFKVTSEALICPEGNAESLNICKQEDDLIKLVLLKRHTESGRPVMRPSQDRVRGECPCLEDPVRWQVPRDRLSSSSAPHGLCLHAVNTLQALAT